MRVLTQLRLLNTVVMVVPRPQASSAPQSPLLVGTTVDVLAEVAAIHRATPDGEKIRRVAEFLGVANNSAGTYINRARKAGLLDSPT